MQEFRREWYYELRDRHLRGEYLPLEDYNRLQDLRLEMFRRSATEGIDPTDAYLMQLFDLGRTWEAIEKRIRRNFSRRVVRGP